MNLWNLNSLKGVEHHEDFIRDQLSNMAPNEILDLLSSLKEDRANAVSESTREGISCDVLQALQNKGASNDEIFKSIQSYTTKKWIRNSKSKVSNILRKAA